jgi:site-specific recombinase XerD
VDAINRGLCKSNPYLEFKVPRGRSKPPTFLEESEIKKIQSFIPDNEKLQRVKDLFVFQCFTGLAFADLINFSKDYISELDGKKIIRSNREKTDESFISLFLPDAQILAEKYDCSFPKISNQKYNDYLKLLGIGSGIKKKLTSHLARHSYSSFLLKTSKLQECFFQQITV